MRKRLRLFTLVMLILPCIRMIPPEELFRHKVAKSSSYAIMILQSKGNCSYENGGEYGKPKV